MDTVCNTCRWWEFEQERKSKKTNNIIREGICQSRDELTSGRYTCPGWRSPDDYKVGKREIYAYGQY